MSFSSVWSWTSFYFSLFSRNEGQQLYDKIRQSKSPFQEFLSCWKKSETSTISQLFSYLEEIDRFDVIDDNRQKIKEDIAHADTIAREKVTWVFFFKIKIIIFSNVSDQYRYR